MTYNAFNFIGASPMALIRDKIKIVLTAKKPTFGIFIAAGSNNLFTVGCDLSTIDERRWTADIRSNSALNPGISKRGHFDSFETAERCISDGGDCRRRDRAT